MPKHTRKKNKTPKNITTKTYSWVYAIIPSILAFVIYSFSFSNGFVNWEDPINFLENPWISNSNLNFFERIVGIFSTDLAGNYNPLSTASFLFDYAFFGIDNPRGWHIVNTLIHAVTCFVVFKVARKIGLNTLGACFLACLFAVHPMHVESVAWISQRKDVLFGFFYFSAIIKYLNYLDDGKKSNLIWLYLTFIASLLCNIQAVSLPFSLVLVDYLSQGNISTKNLLSKWPMWFMSLIIGVVGLIVMQNHGALGDTETLPFWHSLFYLSNALSIYFVKFIIPYPLSSSYPPPDAIGILDTIRFLIIPLLAFGLYRSYTKSRILFFGLAFFLVNVLFAFKFGQTGMDYLADRYTYVAYFGLFFIAAHYIETFAKAKKTKLFSTISGAVFIFVFGYLSIQQIKVWKDGESLWTHAINHYDNSIKAYEGRGDFYYRKGDYKKAIEDFTKGLAVKENSELRANRGKSIYYSNAGQDSLAIAIDDFTKAIELNSNNPDHFLSRGAVYTRLRILDNAISDFTKALVIKPDYDVAYINRGRVLYAMGQYNDALGDFKKAVSFRPNDPEFNFEKGKTENVLGLYNEAVNSFNMAIQQEYNMCASLQERAISYLNLNDELRGKNDVQRALGMGCRLSDFLRAQFGIN